MELSFRTCDPMRMKPLNRNWVLLQKKMSTASTREESVSVSRPLTSPNTVISDHIMALFKPSRGDTLTSD